MEILKDGVRFVFNHEKNNDATSPMINCKDDGVTTPFCILFRETHVSIQQSTCV
jgi:hypothetical protein